MMVYFPAWVWIFHKEYSFVYTLSQVHLFAQFVCLMLCSRGRIDILACVEECVPEFLIHRSSFLLSFLDIAFPFLYVPSAAAVLHAPDVRPARARWRPQLAALDPERRYGYLLVLQDCIMIHACSSAADAGPLAPPCGGQ